jgi:hypothetical protein
LSSAWGEYGGLYLQRQYRALWLRAEIDAEAVHLVHALVQNGDDADVAVA